MNNAKWRQFFTSLPFWLAVCGGLCLIFGDLRVSAGFLVAVLGCFLLLSAWLMWLFRQGRKQELSRKAKRWVKTGKIITFTAVVIGLIVLIVLESLILSQVQGTEDPQAEILIVLGAGLRDAKPSATLQSRLDAALEYLNAHPDAVAVLTGGKGHNESVTEASAMALYLENHGIDPSRLYLEEQARNTRENMQYSRELIEEKQLSGSIAVASNGFHLYRAKRLAARENMQVETVSAPVPYLWLVPSVYLREACSLLLMFAKEIF